MSTEPLLLDVERLTFGFDALAHHERQVVFVPYAAPGDRVAAHVVERRRGYLRVEIDEVQRPGPDRTLPGCAYFPTCGGCQWQHVAPDAQRRAKAEVVAEQLARIGGFRDVPVEPTRTDGPAWGYRARVTLVVEGRRAGLLRARSRTIVEVAACPIAAPAVSTHLATARTLVAVLRVAVQRVAVVAVPDGVVLVVLAASPFGPADVDAAETLVLQTSGVRGVVLRNGGRRVVIGDATTVVPLEPGLHLEVPADTFTQVNPSANAHLVAAVMRAAAPADGARVLDLYAGAGNFALPAARRGARVEAVERDVAAVEAGRANADRLRLAVAFRAAAVADALPAVAPGSIDTVILDPPRSGAPEAIAPIATLRARRIVYVSCDPATLARDLRALDAHGYRLARVEPVDLFPQTYHIESVAELHLT